MSLTPEQIAAGWRLHDGSDVCPIKDDRTRHKVMFRSVSPRISREQDYAACWAWEHTNDPEDIIAYRIIEAHGADAEPARPTPFPQSYTDLVFTDDGWSQTIIVDGKRPEWLRDDDRCISDAISAPSGWTADNWFGDELAIRVRRREPKRETVPCRLSLFLPYPDGPVEGVSATIDLIDGKPDLSTLKIAEEAAE